MAAISGTSVSNDNANGYIVADGFMGAPSATDKANQRQSTQAAVFPNGTSTTVGPSVETITTVAAAGATQGTATAVPATALIVIVTLTASSEGVKMPTAVAGNSIVMLADTAHSYKVYGGAAGQSINAGTTATTAVVIGTNKTATFYAKTATKWIARVA